MDILLISKFTTGYRSNLLDLDEVENIIKTLVISSANSSGSQTPEQSPRLKHHSNFNNIKELMLTNTNTVIGRQRSSSSVMTLKYSYPPKLINLPSQFDNNTSIDNILI